MRTQRQLAIGVPATEEVSPGSHRLEFADHEKRPLRIPRTRNKGFLATHL